MNKKLTIMFVLFSYYNIYGLSDDERVILEKEIPNEFTDIQKIILQNQMPDYKAISKNGFLEIIINKNTDSGGIEIKIKTKDKEKQDYIDYLIKKIDDYEEKLLKLYLRPVSNAERIETTEQIIKKLKQMLQDL